MLNLLKYFLFTYLFSIISIFTKQTISSTNTTAKMNFYNFSDCASISITIRNKTNRISCNQLLIEPLLFPVANNFSFVTNELSLLITRKNFPTLPNYIFSGGIFSSISLEDNLIENISEKAFDYILLIRKLNLSKNRLTNLAFLSSSLNSSNGLCSTVAFDALVELDLSSNQIESLDEGNFCCLRSLEKLYLNRNKLFEIDMSIFKGLSKLEILRLDINRIHNVINSKNHTDLIGLSSLHLQKNSIRFIQSFVFNRMSNLSNLILSLNPLDHLTTKVFYGLTNVSNFIIRNCSLNELNEFIFEGLTNLSQLVLEHCNISVIKPKAFLNLKLLKILKLDGNRITQLYGRTFEKQAILEHIDLTGSVLERLQPFAFVGLVKLRRVQFSLANDLTKDGYCNLLQTFEEMRPYNIKRYLNGKIYYQSVNIQILNHFNCKMTTFFLFKFIHLNLITDLDLKKLIQECLNYDTPKKLNEIKNFSC
jgi:Leucine-rich repeat (LRR) protein